MRRYVFAAGTARISDILARVTPGRYPALLAAPQKRTDPGSR